MPNKWVQALSLWFDHNQRPMPWRQTSSPYRTWVSEIMLQQTQVATVIPYFKRFTKRFPSITTLAQAPLDDVLKHWEGLGYYSRARNLHQAAIDLYQNNHAQLPKNFSDLLKVKGIGSYTAAAIASIAFEEAIPVVDGNVSRVFSRFWGLYDDIRLEKSKKQIFQKLKPFIQVSQASQFNQAIMELGALICKPHNPNCVDCPINHDCFAKRHNKQKELPVKSKAKKIPTLDVVVAIILKNDQFLIAKRPQNKMLGGLWELPGGKVENQEKPQDAVTREIKEEVNLKIKDLKELGKIRHSYTHFHLRMQAFSCQIKSGQEKALCSDQLRWITWQDRHHFAFPKANLKLFDLIDKKSLFTKKTTN